MIRALGTGPHNQPVVILGLTTDNLERLAASRPIRLNLHYLDPDGPPTRLPDIDIVIFSVAATPREELGRLFDASTL